MTMTSINLNSPQLNDVYASVEEQSVEAASDLPEGLQVSSDNADLFLNQSESTAYQFSGDLNFTQNFYASDSSAVTTSSDQNTFTTDIGQSGAASIGNQFDQLASAAQNVVQGANEGGENTGVQQNPNLANSGNATGSAPTSAEPNTQSPNGGKFADYQRANSALMNMRDEPARQDLLNRLKGVARNDGISTYEMRVLADRVVEFAENGDISGLEAEIFKNEAQFLQRTDVQRFNPGDRVEGQAPVDEGRSDDDVNINIGGYESDGRDVNIGIDIGQMTSAGNAPKIDIDININFGFASASDSNTNFDLPTDITVNNYFGPASTPEENASETGSMQNQEQAEFSFAPPNITVNNYFDTETQSSSDSVEENNQLPVTDPDEDFDILNPYARMDARNQGDSALNKLNESDSNSGGVGEQRQILAELNSSEQVSRAELFNYSSMLSDFTDNGTKPLGEEQVASLARYAETIQNN